MLSPSLSPSLFIFETFTSRSIDRSVVTVLAEKTVTHFHRWWFAGFAACRNYNCQLPLSPHDFSPMLAYRIIRRFTYTIFTGVRGVHRARKLQVLARGDCGVGNAPTFSLGLGLARMMGSSERESVRGCGGGRRIYTYIYPFESADTDTNAQRHTREATGDRRDERITENTRRRSASEHLPVARTGRAGIYAPS